MATECLKVHNWAVEPAIDYFYASGLAATATSSGVDTRAIEQLFARYKGTRSEALLSSSYFKADQQHLYARTARAFPGSGAFSHSSHPYASYHFFPRAPVHSYEPRGATAMYTHSTCMGLLPSAYGHAHTLTQPHITCTATHTSHTCTHALSADNDGGTIPAEGVMKFCGTHSNTDTQRGTHTHTHTHRHTHTHTNPAPPPCLCLSNPLSHAHTTLS